MPSKKILGMFAGAVIGGIGATAFVLAAPVVAPVAIVTAVAAIGAGGGTIIGAEIDEAELKKDMEGFKKDHKNSKEEISNLKADNKNSKEEIANLSKKDKEKDIKISNLENDKEEQKKINENLEKEITKLKNEVESLNAQIKNLEKQNDLLIEEIEKFKLKINENFNERISFNEKKIVEIFKLLQQTEEIFKKIQETTSFYIHKNFELNQNLQERKDSIKSEEIMVMSDHSNQNSLIQTSDDEFYVLERHNESSKKTKNQDLLQKENEEEKKKEELKKIEEQKDLLCIPQTKMIFELAEEIRSNQIEANKTREEKVNVISNEEKVKDVLSHFEIQNNLEKPIVFVK